MKTTFQSYLNQHKHDERHMRTALEVAEQAGLRGDKPIGAILVLPGTPIAESDTSWTESRLGTATNNVIKKANDFGHSLKNGILYSTIEPPALDVLLAAEHGIQEIVFGAYHQNGFVSSKVLNLDKLPLSYRGGVLAHEARAILPASLREQTSENDE